MLRPQSTAITLHRSDMISDGEAEAIKEDDAMSVFFMDFDMAPSVIWARDLYDLPPAYTSYTGELQNAPVSSVPVLQKARPRHF